ncbi:hypothetical protein AVEN_131326-1 [Araneus ventricosus]|uniref:Uncharacterized protein n=1 Tax=Araneus ventricosus TaxID=182803 RepID=A0A4Y2V4S9_ARAVE|nr:hypothetical protein AVEN_131326-1 [Araneus ventricosus]
MSTTGVRHPTNKFQFSVINRLKEVSGTTRAASTLPAPATPDIRTIHTSATSSLPNSPQQSLISEEPLCWGARHGASRRNCLFQESPGRREEKNHCDFIGVQVN